MKHSLLSTITGNSLATATAAAAVSATTVRMGPSAPYEAAGGASSALHRPRRAAVIGASLGGLGAATALSQIGDGSWRVDVYERRPNGNNEGGGGNSGSTQAGGFHDSGGSLGYVNVPSWEALRGDGVPMMRRGRRANRGQGAFFYGDLWKYLWGGLPQNASIQYGKAVQGIGSVDHPVIDGVPYDLVVLADGGFSTLRNLVLTADAGDEADDRLREGNDEQRSSIGPEYAGYVVWRGSVSPNDLPARLQHQIREGVYKNGMYDTIVLKMAKDNGEDLWTFGTMVATPESDLPQYWDRSTEGGRGRHEHASSSSDVSKIPEWFLPLFSSNFASTPWLVELVERVIDSGELNPHPQYQFGANRVSRGRVLMLGDAAHMASPRTAVGAHTAITDALALREAFDAAAAAYVYNASHEDDEDEIDLAIKLYSKSGVDRAQQLYRRSLEVSQEFVPSGGMKSITSPSRVVALPGGNRRD